MPELTFRNAEEKDVPLILEFIKKLADYEHRLDEVIATEEALKYWIFDKNQAEVIFALEDGKEIGFAFFFLSFSTYIANVNMHLEEGNRICIFLLKLFNLHCKCQYAP